MQTWTLRMNPNDSYREMVDVCDQRSGKRMVWATLHMDAFAKIGEGALQRLRGGMEVPVGFVAVNAPEVQATDGSETRWP